MGERKVSVMMVTASPPMGRDILSEVNNAGSRSASSTDLF